jgi:site-specific recombinase XerD
MMNLPTLATLLSAFFLRHLAAERGVSPHTITSYRDSIKLLLQFSATRCRRSVDQLTIEDLTAPLVLDFVADLETTRGNTIRTRNARLAAVQTFFRYIAGREPALAAACNPVLAIPAKKSLHPLLGYLTEQELGHLLSQVDRLATRGERDYVLLSVLYDTGARIQELLDLAPRGPATSTWKHRILYASVARGVVNAYAHCCRNRHVSFGHSCPPWDGVSTNQSPCFRTSEEHD